MFKPDSITGAELKVVAARLTPWFDSRAVKKLASAAYGVATPQEKPLIESEASASGAADRMDGISLPPEFTLEECFAIYILGDNSIADPASPGKDFKQLVKEASRWHHQLKVDGKPVAYARSKASDCAEGCEVCQLFISSLAEAVDDAIKWLMKYEEEHLKDRQPEPWVRLLAVPAHNVHAFWLHEEETGQNELLVIDAPAELIGLKREQLLSSEDFLKAFEGQKPIAGLVLDGVNDEEEGEETDDSKNPDGNANNTLIKTEREGDHNMSDPKGTPVPGTDPDDDTDVAPVAENITFHVPGLKEGEQAKFLSFIFDAEISKGFIEEGLNPANASGAGKPVYSAYAFPYVPPDNPKDDGQGADGSGQKIIEPLYTVYVYPFMMPNTVDLGGDGPGTKGALGGVPGPTSFYARIKPLMEDEKNKQPETPEENKDSKVGEASER